MDVDNNSPRQPIDLLSFQEDLLKYYLNTFCGESFHFRSCNYCRSRAEAEKKEKSSTEDGNNVDRFPQNLRKDEKLKASASFPRLQKVIEHITRVNRLLRDPRYSIPPRAENRSLDPRDHVPREAEKEKKKEQRRLKEIWKVRTMEQKGQAVAVNGKSKLGKSPHSRKKR